MSEHQEPVIQMHVDADGDLFIIRDGVKIAKRGEHGTPQAKTWISLEPGWRVLDGPSPGELSSPNTTTCRFSKINEQRHGPLAKRHHAGARTATALLSGRSIVAPISTLALRGVAPSGMDSARPWQGRDLADMMGRNLSRAILILWVAGGAVLSVDVVTGPLPLQHLVKC
jgi:hypothetical protein